MNRFNAFLSSIQNQNLEKAYQAAVNIQQLERQYLQGQTPGKAVNDYFQSILNKQLTIIRYHLTQVRISRFLLQYGQEIPQEIIDKLAYIEETIDKYRQEDVIPRGTLSENRLANNTNSSSLVNTALQLTRPITPEYEQQVVESLRKKRRQEITAVRWLVILIVIPLIVQIVSRNIIFEPLLDKFRDVNPQRVALTQEITERYLNEYDEFKSILELKELVGAIPELTPEARKQELKDKALEMYQQAGYKTLDGVKNLLADLTALGTFTILILIGRSKLMIIRGFTDRAFLSLNDAAKVFLIILFSDLFVGFHSAEGWEVLLGGITEHFGLPENRNLIYGFIATIPVLLDSCFKFWIFNYLTRSSPASVAIYEKMNQ